MASSSQKKLKTSNFFIVLLELTVSVPARTREKPSIPRRFNAFSSLGSPESSKLWKIVAWELSFGLIPLSC